MKSRHFIAKVLMILMVVSQFGWTAAAAADTEGRPAPSVSPTAVATPVPTVSPTVTATPATTPSPTASPSPTVAAEPVVTATPEPTEAAKPSPTAAPDEVSTPQTEVRGHADCGGSAPKWVFDTGTRKWQESDISSFACDMTTGLYLSPKYFYDKRIGWYEIIPAAQVASLPDYMITAPNVVHTVLGDLVIGSSDYQVAKALGLLDGGGSGGILAPAGTAGASNVAAAPSGAGGSQSWFDLTNLVNVVNILQSNATSGNVNATSNTKVGDMATGAASVVANLINLLASAWSWSNGSLSFFMQNILAPLTGDINLNPTVATTGGGGGLGSATLQNTGAGSTNTVDLNNPATLNVNAKDSGSITNNVNVGAISGNATAKDNTAVGNIATGNAMAQVNIINLINSFITSGSSFFGILNIFGSLNGDILFPAGFLTGLVPASAAPATVNANIGATGPGSTNQLGVDNSRAQTINNSVNNAVTNNITTTAGSGAASVGSTTTAGTVQTGSAATNQGLFNLANSSIFGDNAVLVMVNVLGHWVGKIMSLPGTGGSQSALLTSNASVAPNGPIANLNIDGTGAGSTNQANVDNSKKANINLQTSGTITNNVNVNAQSGNAAATDNTKVGDVSTGNAQANSSVANLFNTVLNVKHWFGVLIINVFGDWTGDVNHDSAAGGYSTAPGQGAGAAGGPAAAGGGASADGLRGVGQGLAALMPSYEQPKPAGGAAVASGGIGGVSGAKVLTAAAQTMPATATAAAAQSRNLSFLFTLSALVMMVAGALMTIEKKLRQ